MSNHIYFIYTIPSKELSAKIGKPEGIKGESSAFEIGEWPKQGVDKKTGALGNYASSIYPWSEGLIEAAIKAAY